MRGVGVLCSQWSAHLETLCATFQRAHESGQCYNLSKCRFNVPEVAYYGHVISADGIKVDPRKVEAIVNMVADNTGYDKLAGEVCTEPQQRDRTDM